MKSAIVNKVARRLGMLRAGSYCRTSSEGQRDNTSIDTQKETNEKFIKQNRWKFVRHYVDECKTGSKIAGRDDYQKMMKDAANDKLDIIVAADIKRYSRDGFDIINSARTLVNDFNVHVVDAKGAFDTRSRQNVLTNFVHAGVAEADRLGILERTINGRIKKAEKGEPWYGPMAAPVGRQHDKNLNQHKINDKGRRILDICHRYLDGEQLGPLCEEHGISHKSKFSYWVWHSQLSGDYYATFNQPEVGIVDHKVLVPGMPEVVPAKLLEKVKKRLRFNRTHNRTDAKQYLLQGYVHCGVCKKSLTGKMDPRGTRYRHNGTTEQTKKCDFASILGKRFESQILDYLYFHFLDAAAFQEAVTRAMPADDTRKALVDRKALTTKRLKQKDREATNLVAAIQGGGKLRELLKAQDELEKERKRLTKLILNLETELEALPDEDTIRSSAEELRYMLYQEYQNRNWRELPQPEIKRFLLNLFGDDDGTAGIFLRHDDQGRLVVEFKGRLCPGLRDYRKLDKTLLVKTRRLSGVEQIRRIRQSSPALPSGG